MRETEFGKFIIGGILKINNKVVRRWGVCVWRERLFCFFSFWGWYKQWAVILPEL